MKCLREKGQGPRIDQYFLRSQSSQSNEIQRQEANHSSQDISTPVIDVRRTCMDTVSDEPNDPCEPVEVNVISQFGKIDFWQFGSCSYPASVLCNLNEDGGSMTLSDFATQPLTGLRIAYGV
ncbi:UNVERIFIED_CONTAM: hypothetical protein FKN15_056354 [Acipenser sinensis]